MTTEVLLPREKLRPLYPREQVGSSELTVNPSDVPRSLQVRRSKDGLDIAFLYDDEERAYDALTWGDGAELRVGYFSGKGISLHLPMPVGLTTLSEAIEIIREFAESMAVRDKLKDAGQRLNLQLVSKILARHANEILSVGVEEAVSS